MEADPPHWHRSGSVAPEVVCWRLYRFAIAIYGALALHTTWGPQCQALTFRGGHEPITLHPQVAVTEARNWLQVLGTGVLHRQCRYSLKIAVANELLEGADDP